MHLTNYFLRLTLSPLPPFFRGFGLYSSADAISFFGREATGAHLLRPHFTQGRDALSAEGDKPFQVSVVSTADRKRKIRALLHL